MIRTSRLSLLTAVCAALCPFLARAALASALELAGSPASAWGSSALATAVTGIVTGIGAVVAAWHALSGLALLAVLLVPRGGSAGQRTAARLAARRWCAPLARRAVLSSVALSVGLGLAPAAGAAVTDDLGWAPTTPAATATATTPVSAPPTTADGTRTTAPASASARSVDATAAPTVTATPSRSGAATHKATAPSGRAADSAAGSAAGSDGGTADRRATARTVVVRPGDSLWSITASVVGDDAARVAVAWPSLYEANRQAIGSDPALIRPGTVLSVPDSLRP